MADEKAEAKPVETKPAEKPAKAETPPGHTETSDHPFWDVIKEWVRREVHHSQTGTTIDERRELNP